MNKLALYIILICYIFSLTGMFIVGVSSGMNLEHTKCINKINQYEFQYNLDNLIRADLIRERNNYLGLYLNCSLKG